MTTHQIEQAVALAEHMVTCRCAVGVDGLCLVADRLIVAYRMSREVKA